MADLIPFMARQLGRETVNTVNARDLYAYLKMTGDYSLWIKRAIKRANLVENTDFIVLYQVVENPKGGRPASEHHLTFDAAKHVAMMSSATKGHEVREWFIQKEKELAALHNDPAAILNLYPELRAIAELAVSTAQARALADAAKAEAVQARQEASEARAVAQQAINTQQFLTIHEYVYLNDLRHQVPESLYKEYGLFLSDYCQRNGIPFRPQPVGGRRWETENAYHVGTIQTTLEGWLKRRFAQPALHLIHTQ